MHHLNGRLGLTGTRVHVGLLSQETTFQTARGKKKTVLIIAGKKISSFINEGEKSNDHIN
jgi:hypothetical protein